jgi:hypothetical protein
MDSTPTKQIFSKFYSVGFYYNMSKKIQVWLKSDKNIKHVKAYNIHLCSYLLITRSQCITMLCYMYTAYLIQHSPRSTLHSTSFQPTVMTCCAYSFLQCYGFHLTCPFNVLSLTLYMHSKSAGHGHIATYHFLNDHFGTAVKFLYM